MPNSSRVKDDERGGDEGREDVIEEKKESLNIFTKEVCQNRRIRPERESESSHILLLCVVV